MHNNILSVVKDALRSVLELPADTPIDPDAHMKNDLGIDSVSSMDLLMYLEDHIEGFVVQAGTLEARHFNTAATMTEYIEGELAPIDISSPVKTKI